MNFIFPILPFAIFVFIFQILYPQLGKAYFLPVPVYSLVPLYLFVRLSLLSLPPRASVNTLTSGLRSDRPPPGARAGLAETRLDTDTY